MVCTGHLGSAIRGCNNPCHCCREKVPTTARLGDTCNCCRSICNVGKKLYAATVEADRIVVERVAEVAAKRGVPRAQVALAWVLQKNTCHRADHRSDQDASFGWCSGSTYDKVDPRGNRKHGRTLCTTPCTWLLINYASNFFWMIARFCSKYDTYSLDYFGFR